MLCSFPNICDFLVLEISLQMELRNWLASHSSSSSSSSSPSVERSLSFVFPGNRRHRLESHRGHAEACVPTAQFTVCSKVCPDCSMRLAQVSGFEFEADEARCANTQVMCVFVSTPIAQDVSHGYVAPMQINPDMHIDEDHKSIAARISSALVKAASGLPCPGKPTADNLVSTWHVCQCLENALQSSIGEGLMHFLPRVRQVPLHMASAQGGSYTRSADGRWKLSLDTDDGPEHRWLLPSPA